MLKEKRRANKLSELVSNTGIDKSLNFALRRYGLYVKHFVGLIFFYFLPQLIYDTLYTVCILWGKNEPKSFAWIISALYINNFVG